MDAKIRFEMMLLNAKARFKSNPGLSLSYPYVLGSPRLVCWDSASAVIRAMKLAWTRILVLETSGILFGNI